MFKSGGKGGEKDVGLRYGDVEVWSFHRLGKVKRSEFEVIWGPRIGSNVLEMP